MSRCLIISQAYKRAIGLPVAAVILIDGEQVGATALPSDRLCLFTQTAVCPLYPPPGSIHGIYSYHGRKRMLMMPHRPEEKQEHFQSKLSTLKSVIIRQDLAHVHQAAWHVGVQYISSPHYQSIICSSVPRGTHKLDPIMRRSDDCLCIFGLDFQLYMADITVLDVECRGIGKKKKDSGSYCTCIGSIVFRHKVYHDFFLLLI